MDEKNMTSQEPEVESGISLLDFWMVLKKYLMQIIVLTCLITVIAGVCCKLFVKTKYTAQAVIILNPGLMYAGGNSSTLNEIQADRNAVQYGKELMPSLMTFIKTSKKVKTAIDEANETNENVESLKKGELTVTNASDELQLVLTYTTTTSAEVAVATLNELVDKVCVLSNEEVPASEDETVKATVQYIYPWANTLNVDDYADKASPSNRWKLYTAIAFVLGFILSYVYYFAVTMMDDTVKSKTVIENISGFHVMAYIEELEADTKQNKRATKKQAKNG